MAKEASFLSNGSWSTAAGSYELNEPPNNTFAWPAERILSTAFVLMRMPFDHFRGYTNTSVDLARYKRAFGEVSGGTNHDLRVNNWWALDVFRSCLFDSSSGAFFGDPKPLPWLVWGPALPSADGNRKVSNVYRYLDAVESKLGVSHTAGGTSIDRSASIYDWVSSVSDIFGNNLYRKIFVPALFSVDNQVSESSVASGYAELAKSAYVEQLSKIASVPESNGNDVFTGVERKISRVGKSAMDSMSSAVSGLVNGAVESAIGNITSNEYVDKIVSAIAGATESVHSAAVERLRSALGRLNLVSSSAYAKALQMLESERMAAISGEAARIVANERNQVITTKLALLRDRITAAVNMYGRGYAVGTAIISEIISQGAGAYMTIRNENARTFPSVLLDLATRDVQIAVHHLNHVVQNLAGRIGTGKDLFELSQASLQSAATFQEMAETTVIRNWRPLLEALPGLGGATIIPDKPSRAQLGWMGALAGAYLGLSLLGTFMGKDDSGKTTFAGKTLDSGWKWLLPASVPVLTGAALGLGAYYGMR